MKRIIIYTLLIFSSFSLFGQRSESPLEILIFEGAEKAYNRKDYFDAIEKLDQFDKEVTFVLPKSLYLRIISQNKLINYSTFYDDENNFDLLQSLRTYTATYLDKLAQYGLDEKYREVYEINEKLQIYKTFSKTEFLAEKARVDSEKQKEKERIARIKAEEEEFQKKRKLEEIAKIEEKKRNEEESSKRYAKHIGFTSFYFGYCNPSNEQSKENITYNQWLNLPGQSPFKTSLDQRKIGLKGGINIGFAGLVGFNKINEKIKVKPVSIGFVWDVKQTLLFYNYNKVENVPDIHEFYFYDNGTSPFSITSIGIGPDLTLKFKKFSMDFYAKNDFNIISGGRYKATLVDPFLSDTYYSIAKLKGATTLLSTSYGIRYAKKRIIVGLEIRNGLSTSINYLDYFGKLEFLDKDNAIETKGINPISFNNLCFNFGLRF